ncbi:hypothetical protein EVAR_37927_1 [Eumeta japonica]|uniref:Uncharacterized protein n=1 Tax=Eumeta variegata TaxID=151549 RepID=A0A4C1XC18_EUMVA|nr:hypothetical protein EVAR_37927_1 [Eumeta japonica]
MAVISPSITANVDPRRGISPASIRLPFTYMQSNEISASHPAGPPPPHRPPAAAGPARRQTSLSADVAPSHPLLYFNFDRYSRIELTVYIRRCRTLMA